MKKQKREEIKKASSKSDAFKKERREALWLLLRRIIFWGLILLCWMFNMLLIIFMIAEPESGVKAFIEILNLLSELYFILCGIGVFIFLIEYVFKKKDEGVNEIIVETPTNYKYKK